MSNQLAPIDDVINAIAAGKMVVLVDDEDRENEGDLVIAADYADAAAINFMAKYGRGLICLTLTQDRVAELGLPLMAQHNQTRHQTAFTVSIEAREGVTTGISAADRARTIAVTINPASSRTDIVTPGHVFPLVARDGGVLVRTGHTEASVDLARLGGCTPAAVICEIMNDDGTMARLPDLIPFAQQHNLLIASIADLIAWRRRRETLIERIFTCNFTSAFAGDFELRVYTNRVNYAEHLALIKHPLPSAADTPCLVRMHTASILDDALHDAHSGRGGELQKAMQAIAAHGSGVVVMLREPQADSLSAALKARHTSHATSSILRDYGIGAQILLDIGIKSMVLLSNTDKSLIGLDGYGLHIDGRKAF